MLLQELIRNVVLYKGVLKPLIESWKESLTAGYLNEIIGRSPFTLILALINIQVSGDEEELGWDISDEYEARSVSQIVGTRTITNCLCLYSSFYELACKATISFQATLSSKKILIVLAHARSNEKAVITGETLYQDTVSEKDFIFTGMNQTISATTGFVSKQINSLLIFETHEKREYLGEFSLTHEETPLLYSLRGGDYHDIY